MPKALLTGWGRSTWSRATLLTPPDAEAATRFTQAGDQSFIARGLGRSYGDQATNAGANVLDMTDLDRVGAPDPDGRITVDVGVSIDTLLRTVVPQGWFVPVSPGTRHVTVGGAIAADIHGRNHHVDGTFCTHVEEIVLGLADGSVVACSPTRDPELFWATAGGMGLTGIIVQATLKLKAIQTSQFLVDTTCFTDLDPLLGAMNETVQPPYSAAWVDLMSGSDRCRSVLGTARFALPDELAGTDDPLAFDPRQRLASPSWVPAGLLRKSTVRAFNEAWFRAAPAKRRAELQSIARYLHPLDGVANWNRIYGPGGFLQWQMVVPDGAEDALRRCVEALSVSPTPCFLAVLKRFGPANPGPLSFPLEGWTLAADMPAAAAGLAELLDRLDVVVAEAGGRIYLAKDARMDPDLLGQMYPRLDEWRAVRNRVDPDRKFQSDMSRRLDL